MTRFRRKYALDQLYTAIAPCKEPELVIEAVIMSTVFENRSAFLFLQSVGLEVKLDLMEVKVPPPLKSVRNSQQGKVKLLKLCRTTRSCRHKAKATAAL